METKRPGFSIAIETMDLIYQAGFDVHESAVSLYPTRSSGVCVNVI